jgi:predicted regulator of Ras-like GTPase activity (Roadblock/LC7/MglB family)
MDWDAFQDAHYRPHLVEADLAIASEDTTATVFDRLPTMLGLTGNYAIRKDGNTIRAAFEIDSDAERFAAMLLAKVSSREAEWASRWVGRIDGTTRRRILAALKQHRLKSRGRLKK